MHLLLSQITNFLNCCENRLLESLLLLDDAANSIECFARQYQVATVDRETIAVAESAAV